MQPESDLDLGLAWSLEMQRAFQGSCGLLSFDSRLKGETLKSPRLHNKSFP